MAIYVPIVMYGLRLFTRTTLFTELFTCSIDNQDKNSLQGVTCLFHGCYGYLSLYKFCFSTLSGY